MRSFAIALGLGLLLAPMHTEACEPSEGTRYVYPEDGTVLPANGIVVATGSGLVEEWFLIFVDGVQVEIEFIDRFTSGERSVGVRPVERPAVGSELELRYCGSPQGCQPIGTWTVGEEDHEPPQGPTRIQYDYQDTPLCGVTDCLQDYPIDRLGHLRVESREQGPVYVSVRVRNTAEPSEEFHLQVYDSVSATPSFTISDSMNPGVPPQDAMCVEVRIFDLAGNEAGHALETCAPCHTTTYLEDTCAIWAPEWTDADLFPGGDCEGVSIDPLPPLPAPLDPVGDSTTGTGSSSTGGDDTTAGDSSTSDAPPASTDTGSPPADPTTGDDPSSSGAAEAESPSTGSGGCTTGGGLPPSWLLLSLLGLGLRRRR